MDGNWLFAEILDNIQHTTYTCLMIRTQVYLPDEIHNDLMLVAEAQQVTVSHLIRQGALKIIKEKMKPNRKGEWREFVGAWKGGAKDVSSKINDIYK